MKRTMELNDACEMAKAHPKSFYAPTDKELLSIKPGSYVKVSNRYERFWVRVVEVGGHRIKGTMANTLGHFTPESPEGGFGDEIELALHHVYEVLPEEMMEAKRNAQG